jgi:hypothetical protein
MLDQVPAVAIELFEHRDGAVGFDPGRLHEGYALGEIGCMVAGEIVGVEEQEHAASGLVVDAVGLRG